MANFICQKFLNLVEVITNKIKVNFLGNILVNILVRYKS